MDKIRKSGGNAANTTTNLSNLNAIETAELIPESQVHAQGQQQRRHDSRRE